MQRFFNTAGFCRPEKNYMVEPTRGLYRSIYKLIEDEQYFLLHAPRQTGKTTLLHSLAHRLNREGKYIGVVFSVEAARYESATVFDLNHIAIKMLYATAKTFVSGSEMPPPPENFPDSQAGFFDYLSAWCSSQTKPIVLLIDEVDSLQADTLISLLSQLRSGFQNRPKNFPASVALVGLRDIREYRIRAREGQPSTGSGSPFNVKSESFFLPFFTKDEVDDLLSQHTADTGQVFTPKVRRLIFEFSGGQPWLVNSLANEIVSRILKNDFSKKITPDMVFQAKENLIAQRQTHLDSLLDKLNEERVRRVVMAVLTGDAPNFDNYDDAILYCRDLGIVTTDRPVRFSNPIYREIVTRVLNSGFHDSFNQDIVRTPDYLRPDGTLDMDKMLRMFVEFYRRNAESWLDRFNYREAGHQLLLMAFLQRIVNGGGRIEREMALGNGRTDIAVFWKQQVIAIELKIHHDAYTRSDGLQQLAGYLDRLGQKHGYLVIFDRRPSSELPWDERIRWTEEDFQGKKLTVLEL